MSVFPQTQRVVYEKNTLAEVICQLRFPPILRIDTSPPAEFQEIVRESFPLFSTKHGPKLPPEVPPQVARLVAAELASELGIAYEFTTEDESWKLSLTKDFLALSTSAYENWEDFKAKLEVPLKALRETYKPSFFSRVGLRYVNLIDRSDLGIDEEWNELLEPHVVGEIGSEILKGRIEQSSTETLVSLGDGEAHFGKVKLRHGLVSDSQGQQEKFLIDADYFAAQRIEVGNVEDALDRFNAESGNLFRWCVTSKLETAMRPRQVSR